MRFLAALLHLYPASFRADYGREMESIVAARLRETTGALPRAALWIETIVDVVWNSAAAHFDILRQDLKFSARTLARAPGFALTAVMVTGLGIGANTAAFSVADFVMLRPLPYDDADRLVKLWQEPVDGSGGRNENAPAFYQDWVRNTRSFESMGAHYLNAVNLVGTGDPVRIETAFVTSSLLPILGVPPVRGRLFTESDHREGSPPIILSYSLWQSRFAGDESVIGKSMSIDGSQRVVVGVMPPDFHYPNRNIAIWTPMLPDQLNDDDAGNTYWYVLAKLRRGVTHEQAKAEMKVVANRLRQQYPDVLRETGFAVDRLRDEFSRQSRVLLLALCGAAGCVLLIACANLANLLLARGLVRRRELVVRSALGAGRERLVRQSITESLVLALLGGTLGIFIAAVSLPLLTRLVPTTLPIAQLPTIDPRIIAFAIVLTVITAVGFGVFPAWRSAGQADLGGLRDGARSGGGRRERARSMLVVTEVMASVVLLISAGLLMRALLRIQDTDPGFRTQNVLTLKTVLTAPKYDSTAERVVFWDEVLTGVRGIPGVSSAAYSTGLPMVMTGGVWRVLREGEAPTGGSIERASSRFVSPGYFSSLSIPLRDGRDFDVSDDPKHPLVAVVSESFVKKHLGSGNPIGKRFVFRGDLTLTVAGVVGDVRVRGPERQSEPQVYMSYRQFPNGQGNFYSPKDLLIRSSLPASSLIPAVRRIVQRADPEQPISDIKAMSEIVSDTTAARSVQVRVLLAFAAIAFVLAAIGIHGLLTYSVSSRQHEIGVRIALGAQRGDIVRMIMRQGAILAAAGVVPGLLLAYLAGRSMQSVLAGVEPSDVITFGAAGALCVVMTMIGTLLPTMRAVRVDPATAFRSEA